MSDVTITVRGEHETKIFPERAVARLSVRAEGPERGGVVEQIASIATPVLEDLRTREDAGSVAEWTSEQVSIWASRPWAADGTQLALVQYASLNITATFADFAALSWWISELAEQAGVQVDGIEWELTPATRDTAEAEMAAGAVRVAVARATSYATAIGLASVTPIEIADLGLLTGGDAAPHREMRMMKASFAADAGGGASMEFHPQQIVVSAAVEARFVAR